MKNPEILIEMYKIYGKPTVDWMGFKVTKNNHITYHHIKEDRNGGTETVENGALLTVKAHQLLHKLEHTNEAEYQEYQYWFRVINDIKQRPSDEIMHIMYTKKKKLLEQTRAKQK